EWRERVPELRVLGLTATPPVDADRHQAGRYLDLVGDVTYEIPLPALVRDGVLAPYQDLALLVQPTAAEQAHIAAAHERFAALQTTLATPGSELLSLAMWLQHRLDAAAEADWGVFIIEETDDAIAFARVGGSLGVVLHELAWTLDEMLDPPELDDHTRALADYATGYLWPLKQREEHPLGLGDVHEAEAEQAEQTWGEIRDALRPVGARLTKRGVQRHASALDRLLGLSAAKVTALHDILTAEHNALNDDLRAVVVVDFERATSGRAVRELDGVLDPEAGGAVAVLRSLAAHPDHGALEPVMITGSSLVADADVAQHVADALREAATKHGWRIEVSLEPAGVLTQVVGRGADWKSSRYTLLVTELFERGVTRCIVGTRGLLGEGWDVQSANVLVDLTSVASFVATNQLRGRCLRRDPDRPEKVANLWDVVAIAPTHERGFADWERFVRKHSHVYGVADDGAIERGVGHVHPTFTHLPAKQLAGFMPSIRSDMTARAGQRRTTREAWQIGAPYKNETVESVELRALTATPAPSETESLPPGVAQLRAKTWAHGESERNAALVASMHRKTAAITGATQHMQKAQSLLEAVQDATSQALVPIEQDLTLYQEITPKLRLMRYLLVGTGVFVTLTSGGLIFIAVPALYALISLGAGGWWKRKREKRRAFIITEGDKARLRAVQALEHAQTEAHAIRDAAAAEHALVVANTDAGRSTAQTALLQPLKPDETATLYADVLLDAFQRWRDTHEQAASASVRVGRRADGALHVEMLGADAETTASFARAYREFTGPLADPRYLLLCGSARLDEAKATALAARDASMQSMDASTVTDEAVLAVPEPLGSSRSGADALGAAWEARVGACRVVYTRRGEGAELRAKHARKRWWSARSTVRRVWR
ncbi:MAG: hypothetical protein ACI82G_000989, partial [Bradymonadia bacterium]